MIGAQPFPWQGPSVDPRLIAANSIMQLSTVELEQAITQELDENPALELVERSDCPVCGGPLRFGYCSRCDGSELTIQESSPSSGDLSSVELDNLSQDDSDPLAAIPAPLTLSEQLLTQLQLTLDKCDHEIALYLVGSLDEHGYLTLSVEELAQALCVEATRVYAALKELQKLDPAGIGARNLTECLLIQLERLAAEGITSPPATRAIIQHHLEELGHHQFEHVRSSLAIGREEVEEAFLFIRANLHPYPSHHYYPQSSTLRPLSPPLVPSVVVHQSIDSTCGYDVEVMESRRFLLRLNPLYQQIRHKPDLALSPGESDHVIHFLERARLFISQLQRRYVLLRKVATYLVSYQRDFLSYGPLHLRPLTQKVVAQELNVHVSTISRAIASKFAQLPSREIIPLNRFFSAELRVQELIRQIIANEAEPLSDERIARFLHEEHDITLSRQMVANYRAILGVPAARQRAVLHRTRNEVARKDARKELPS